MTGESSMVPLRAAQFKRVAVTDADATLIARDFTRLLADCHLDALTPGDCRAQLAVTSGCYPLAHAARGRAVQDLRRPHRLHSPTRHRLCARLPAAFPNDFKLRFFEEAVREAFPGGDTRAVFRAGAEGGVR